MPASSKRKASSAPKSVSSTRIVRSCKKTASSKKTASTKKTASSKKTVSSKKAAAPSKKAETEEEKKVREEKERVARDAALSAHNMRAEYGYRSEDAVELPSEHAQDRSSVQEGRVEVRIAHDFIFVAGETAPKPLVPILKPVDKNELGETELKGIELLGKVTTGNTPYRFPAEHGEFCTDKFERDNGCIEDFIWFGKYKGNWYRSGTVWTLAAQTKRYLYILVQPEETYDGYWAEMYKSWCGEDWVWEDVDWKGPRPTTWRHLQTWLEWKEHARLNQFPSKRRVEDKSGDVARPDDADAEGMVPEGMGDSDDEEPKDSGGKHSPTGTGSSLPPALSNPPAGSNSSGASRPSVGGKAPRKSLSAKEPRKPLPVKQPPKSLPAKQPRQTVGGKMSRQAFATKAPRYAVSAQPPRFSPEPGEGESEGSDDSDDQTTEHTRKRRKLTTPEPRPSAEPFPPPNSPPALSNRSSSPVQSASGSSPRPESRQASPLPRPPPPSSPPASSPSLPSSPPPPPPPPPVAQGSAPIVPSLVGGHMGSQPSAVPSRILFPPFAPSSQASSQSSGPVVEHVAPADLMLRPLHAPAPANPPPLAQAAASTSTSSNDALSSLATFESEHVDPLMQPIVTNLDASSQDPYVTTYARDDWCDSFVDPAFERLLAALTKNATGDPDYDGNSPVHKNQPQNL
ncbi:hypothetical protein FRC12_024015 [Ceratobasidium sp. 428]|nr:hypothetical protein FRC12_024015 [Ceratobasidium sp. 428]